jgi:WD40 repeat protein
VISHHVLRGICSLVTDGNFIATGTGSGRVSIARLKETGTGQAQNYENRLAPILALAWSPDSTTLAFSRADKTVSIFSLATASITSTLSQGSTVNGLAWEAGAGERLATAASDGTLHVWTVASGKYASYNAHSGALTSATWGSRGLATGSIDAKILLWNI